MTAVTEFIIALRLLLLVQSNYNLAYQLQSIHKETIAAQFATACIFNLICPIRGQTLCQVPTRHVLVHPSAI